VANFVAKDGKTSASVVGTRVYQVILEYDRGKVMFECECPVGQSGRFCKHAVALGLYRLNEKDEKTDGKISERVSEYTVSTLSVSETESAKGLRREFLKSAAGNLFESGASAKATQAVSTEETGCKPDIEENLELLWRNFAMKPTLACYQRLKEFAERSRTWPQWREQAFDHLRRTVRMAARSTTERRKQKKHATIISDNSEVVGIWIEEGEMEEAWMAARTGDCSDELWMKLAAGRARRNPDEALNVYQRLINRNLGRKDWYSAQQAVKILKRVRRLMRFLNRTEEFDRYVTGLVKRYGDQRSFRQFATRKDTRH
jgi:uncharacterized Zn finger protein